MWDKPTHTHSYTNYFNSENLLQLFQGVQPQLIRFLQQAGQRPRVGLDDAVHGSAVLSDRPRRIGDRCQRLVGGVLLHAGHLVGEAVLLFDDSGVEGVDGGELGGGDVGEVAIGAALEEVGELGLELGAGDGVEEANVEGGAAAAEPEERALEGGDPGGAEERGGVELGELGAGGAVILEMLVRLWIRRRRWSESGVWVSMAWVSSFRSWCCWLIQS